MLCDRDSAADCVQDTFCTAAVNLNNLREPDKLRPWLYSIARHEALSRLRERRRERPSDELPDVASRDAGPITLAHRLELANLIAEAAGGLSDRDRVVLELSYRHGLDGPELAEALGVSHSNAGTLVHRLRDVVDRSLGALLVSRQVQSYPSHCAQLAAILRGWDGHFTVLIRKRVSRHIESCPDCDRARRRLVNPVALLGGAPVLIPAPHWLRDRMMREVQLTSADSEMTTAHAPSVNQPRNYLGTNAFQAAAEPAEEAAVDARNDTADSKRRFMLLVALLIGIPLTVLGVVIAWLHAPDTPVAPIGETVPSVTPIATPVGSAPTTAPRSKPLSSNPAGRPQPTGTTGNAPTTTAAGPEPSALGTASAPSTPQPSAQVPPSTPLPTPLPSLPAQTPTPTPPPAPANTEAPAPGDLLPPVKTYKPGPYTERTFVPPN